MFSGRRSVKDGCIDNEKVAAAFPDSNYAAAGVAFNHHGV
jgi:hypothetical protein